MDKSWLCTLCNQTQAQSFCPCSRPETFLCSACIQSHFAKFPGRFHPHLPVLAFGHHKAHGYFDRLQTRLEALETGKEALLKNVEEVDRCITDFTEKMDSLIAAMTEYGREKLELLQQEKARISEKVTTVIAEAERTIYEEDPQLTFDLSYCLRTDTPESDFHLFDYEIKTKANVLKHAIELNFSFQDVSGSVLPEIDGNSLHLFNIRTNKTESVKLSRTIPPLAMCCFLDFESILCIGGAEVEGSQAISTVNLLSLSNFEITAQKHMLESRVFPGVLKHGQFVYVFGGSVGPNQPLKSCEKFAIPDKTWSRLADMHTAKDLFSPCLWRGDVYLPLPNQHLEVFNISSENFKTLQVSFEIQEFTASVDSVVSFVAGKELISIVSRNVIGRLSLPAKGNFHLASSELSNAENAFSFNTPIRSGRCVCWVSPYEDNCLVTFDLNQSEVREVKTKKKKQ